MSVRSATDRIAMQCGGDAISVPNAVRVILLAVRFDWKRRRDSRKRRRHSNSSRIAWLGKKKSLPMQTRESAANFVFADVDLVRDLRRIRNATRVRSDLVDRELNFCVEIELCHGRS